MSDDERQATRPRVDPEQSFPALEERVLQRWRERDVFARVAAPPRRAREPWVFYEGPPTANGRPGAHHVLARVFKDIYPRFQTMRATSSSARAAGTPTGCRSRSRSSSELGIGSKAEIEAYGIAEFNAKCRESVFDLPRGLERADRADRVLARPRRRLPHARPELHRVGLVGAAPDLRQGPALRGPQGRPVLPALRHRAVEPRGRARLPGRRRPVGLRPLPGRRGRRPAAGRRRAARLDHDAVDARLQRRRRRRPRADVRAREDRRA